MRRGSSGKKAATKSPRIGDVYDAQLGDGNPKDKLDFGDPDDLRAIPNIGDEFGLWHMVIILQVHTGSKLLNVVPITSMKEHTFSYNYAAHEVLLANNCLDISDSTIKKHFKEGYALVHQFRPLSIYRLGAYRGQLDSTLLLEVRGAVRSLIGL